MPAPSSPAPDAVADRRLLDCFPQRERSTIANRFLGVVRDRQATTPDAVYQLVLDGLRERWGWTIEHSREPWANQQQQLAEAAQLAEQLGTLTREREAGIAFARWALEWAALPPEERERRKRDKGAHYVRARMDQEEPTEKQVAYLRRLGYDGPIDSKAHASSLIDIYLRGDRVEVRGAA